MTAFPESMQRTVRCVTTGAGAIETLLARIVRLQRAYLARQERHTRVLLAVQILYAALFSGWLVYHHSWPAPDVVAIFLLLFALLAARGLSFLRDWSPFILLLLGYVALAGIADGLVSSAHVQFPIDADRALFFGTLPTTWLQAHLWDPSHLRWYDYMASVLYPMHFIVPLVLGFVLWMWKKRFYWRFVASYLLLCYAGFVTYVLYPMAPPWWAANEHRIAAVQPILSKVSWGGVSNPVVLATRFFKPNPVAAMPSIHAAFPVLVWLVLWRIWSKWGWIAIVYPIAMAFSVIYMGEHYFIDCLVGWIYAVAAYYIVWGSHVRLRRWLAALWPRRSAPEPVLVPVPVRADPRPRR